MQVLQRIFRAISEYRGGYRLLRYLNDISLRAGINPIRVAVMRDGTRMALDLRSHTEWYAYYSGRYDEHEIRFIFKLLKKLDGGFLDVGANIGMYSVRIARAVEKNQSIICFEPMPENVKRIQQNLFLNSLCGRVVVQEIALSNSEGIAELVLREDFEAGSNTGNASISISDAADGRFKKITVSKNKFDKIRAELGVGLISVVKADIEGHEDFFLIGAKEFLFEERPVIFLEINNWFYGQRKTTSSKVLSGALPCGYGLALLEKNRESSKLKYIEFDELQHIANIETCIFFPVEKKSLLEQAATE